MQEIKSTISAETKSTPYCIELNTLWYDREYLLDHLNNIDNDSWYEFNCGHIRWTVHEAFNSRLECKNFKWSEFHLELAMLFNPPITPDTMLYTSTPVGNIWSESVAVGANTTVQIYVGAGNRLTVTGTFTAAELGTASSATESVTGAGS